jgi:hypothetical protein
MHTQCSFLGFFKRLPDRWAIGQILREDYLYEVHGPFVAGAPSQPERPFRERSSGRLSASIGRLFHWSRLHDRATM